MSVTCPAVAESGRACRWVPVGRRQTCAPRWKGHRLGYQHSMFNQLSRAHQSMESGLSRLFSGGGKRAEPPQDPARSHVHGEVVVTRVSGCGHLLGRQRVSGSVPDAAGQTGTNAA